MAIRPLSPAHQPADGAHQLVGLVARVVRAAVAVEHAVARVAVQQAERDLVQRRLDGGDLGQHVDAVAVVLDHARHAADLTLDPGQALVELFLGGGVAARLGHAVQCTTTPEGYLDGDPLFLVQEEAGGVENLAVAQAREALLGFDVGLPGRDRRGVLHAGQPVLLGLVVGLAQPREVVGDAARALGAGGAGLPGVVAGTALGDALWACQGNGEGTHPVGARGHELQYGHGGILTLSYGGLWQLSLECIDIPLRRTPDDALPVRRDDGAPPRAVDRVVLERLERGFDR